MTANIPPQDLVTSSLESQQTLTAVIAGLSGQQDFSSLQTQLDAYRTALELLQTIPPDSTFAFDKVKDLLSSINKQCCIWTEELRAKALLVSTDWSSLTRDGKNVTALSSTLRMYTSSLVIGGISAAK